MLRLLICDIQQIAPLQEELQKRLPPFRLAQMKRYRLPEDQLRCLAGGLLIGHALGESCWAKLSFGSQGKPFFPEGPFFNLSHSGDFTALAVCHAPVGIDIQKQGPADFFALANRCFHPAERQLLASAPDTAQMFYTLWTLKESYMKADGRGFSLDPLSFAISWNTPELAQVAGAPDSRLYPLACPPGYSAALCTTGEDQPPPFQWIRF